MDRKERQICLKDLVIFDSLKVGPVKICKDKISAPYTIMLKSGVTHTNELTYHYGEEVFSPDNPADINLASMIAVQVALNYGLFSEVIIFDGWFDKDDKKFIQDMMDNTSKEIYVMKFLHHNPFLLKPFNNPITERRRTYTAARIEFVNSAFPTMKTEGREWNTNRDKHCVLSSGGKDSLLTYGILKEIGREVHPIFINESGRHWFTALNGFRYLHSTDQNTAKVWCNSDRIFNWILKHMPFIRRDFSAIRSDEYPIRLWTVAVFIFGVLPIVKKREIGRLLIGDEYDCTDRKKYRGIQHYNGLYDQSIYFDRTITHYFFKKKWSVSQFSILRSLSEILIMKILGTRYPHLQRNQVSCHAAHSENERIWPCGKCEKCRRIIAMMLALRLNPATCGYSENLVKNAISRIQTDKVNQLKSDAGHLYYLLIRENIIPESSPLIKYAKSNPPTTHLRFDRERSLLSVIPPDMRNQILELYLKYADGALIRTKHKWEKIHILNTPEIHIPVTTKV